MPGFFGFCVVPCEPQAMTIVFTATNQDFVFFFLLNFSFQRHYNDEDPEKEKRIKELELLLMSTENELKGQQALPVSCLCVLDPSGG